mmetsp:Transcript_9900/g.14410  ORF Transcript_9900/g.14410 Transcript_9900/m.14410 type:complete len:203 (+) Transcript_9900:531-1139(+)
MNLDNNNNNNNNNTSNSKAPRDGAQHGGGGGVVGNSNLGSRIRVKGVDFGEECVRWNYISSNDSNGVNLAAKSNSDSNSMPSRSNSRSLGAISGFNFSLQSQSQSQSQLRSQYQSHSQSQSNYAEGLYLGPSRSSARGIRDSDEYEDHDHDHDHPSKRLLQWHACFLPLRSFYSEEVHLETTMKMMYLCPGWIQCHGEMSLW